MTSSTKETLRWGDCSSDEEIDFPPVRESRRSIPPTDKSNHDSSSSEAVEAYASSRRRQDEGRMNLNRGGNGGIGGQSTQNSRNFKESTDDQNYPPHQKRNAKRVGGNGDMGGAHRSNGGGGGGGDRARSGGGSRNNHHGQQPKNQTQQDWKSAARGTQKYNETPRKFYSFKLLLFNSFSKLCLFCAFVRYLYFW